VEELGTAIIDKRGKMAKIVGGMRCGNPTRLMRLATVVPHTNCVIVKGRTGRERMGWQLYKTVLYTEIYTARKM